MVANTHRMQSLSKQQDWIAEKNPLQLKETDNDHIQSIYFNPGTHITQQEEKININQQQVLSFSTDHPVSLLYDDIDTNSSSSLRANQLDYQLTQLQQQHNKLQTE